MNQQHQQFQQALLDVLPALRRYCLSLTGQLHSAEDLLQATVERALDRWQQYQPDTYFNAWLYRLCRNLWIDTMRKEKPTDSLDDEQESLGLNESTTDTCVTGQQHEAQLTLARVQHHMAKLSEGLRTALYLVAVEGRSYQEVATIMDVPVGTIMSRVSRARQQLSESL